MTREIALTRAIIELKGKNMNIWMEANNTGHNLIINQISTLVTAISTQIIAITKTIISTLILITIITHKTIIIIMIRITLHIIKMKIFYFIIHMIMELVVQTLHFLVIQISKAK
jgi:hypothetical protein